jgi:hypothetical protein
VVVKVTGTPNTTTQKAISFYRLIVDNECVYVGQKDNWAWNTDDWSEGPHTLTVHAVDSSWLAGVAQIQVTIDRSIAAIRGKAFAADARTLERGAEIEVFDVSGRRVATLGGGKARHATILPVGAYVARRTAAGKSSMVLLKGRLR